MIVTQEILSMMEQPPKMKKLDPLELRLAAGIETQEEMSNITRMSRSTVYLAENSAQKGNCISKKTARKYASAIKVRGVTVWDGIEVSWQTINWIVE